MRHRENINERIILKRLSNTQCIVIPIIPEMVELATIRAANLPKSTLKNSVMKGKKTMIGFLGEIALNYLLMDSVVENTFDYDLIYKGLKIEVKTKDTTVVPQIDYEGTVPAYNKTQQCDVYAFLRVLNDLSNAYFCGMIQKNVFDEKAYFVKEGQRYGSNNWKARVDCWNMFYYDLIIPDLLIEHAKKSGFETINWLL